MSDPEAPRGVAVLFTDGSRVDCVLIYTGEEDGQHQWEAIFEWPPDAPDAGLLNLVCEMLPPHTDLNLTFPSDCGWVEVDGDE